MIHRIWSNQLFTKCEYEKYIKWRNPHKKKIWIKINKKYILLFELDYSLVIGQCFYARNDEVQFFHFYFL